MTQLSASGVGGAGGNTLSKVIKYTDRFLDFNKVLGIRHQQ